MGWRRASAASSELELASHRSADLVREAKQRAADIIAQAEKRAAEIVEEAKASAKDEGGRILVGAKAEVEQEVFRARESITAAGRGSGCGRRRQKFYGAKWMPNAHADLLASIKAEL